MWVWTKQFLRELKTASSLLGWGAKVHISSSANEQSCKLIRALNNSILEAKLCCRGGRPKGSGLEPHPSAGRWKILPRARLMFSSRMGTRNNHGVLLSDISMCASQGTGGGFWFPPPPWHRFSSSSSTAASRAALPQKGRMQRSTLWSEVRIMFFVLLAPGSLWQRV